MNVVWKFLAIAAATVATWAAWLGWDSGYQVDPVTLQASGPYEAWQVAGCVLCLAVIAAVGGWLAGPWIVVPALSLSFTAAWTAWAMARDDSGLFAVGAVLVLIGTAVGSLAVSLGSWAARAGLRVRRLRAGSPPGPPANTAGR